MKDELIRNGSIIAVPLLHLGLKLDEIKRPKEYGFELIGKLFKDKNISYLILKYKNRNQTILNLQHAPSVIINYYRKSTETEKEHWRKSKALFTTTMNMQYPNPLTVVSQVDALIAIRRWCAYYASNPDDMNESFVPYSMRNFSELQMQSATMYLFNRTGELLVNPSEIDTNLRFKKDEIYRLLPGSLKSSQNLYNMFLNELNTVWKIAENIALTKKYSYKEV